MLPDELDAGRQAERDRVDTDMADSAYELGQLWRALRREGLPWLVAAAIVVRSATEYRTVYSAKLLDQQ